MPRKSKTTPPRPAHRPRRELSKDLCETIYVRLASGESLHKICSDKSLQITDTIIYRIMHRDPEFAMKIFQARVAGCHAHYDKVLELTESINESNFNSVRTAIWSLQWVLGKMAPKVFGDQVQQHLHGHFGLLPGGREDDDSARALLAARLAGKASAAIQDLERSRPLTMPQDLELVLGAVRNALEPRALLPFFGSD